MTYQTHTLCWVIWVWTIYVCTVTNECTVTMLLYTYQTFKNVISIWNSIRHRYWTQALASASACVSGPGSHPIHMDYGFKVSIGHRHWDWPLAGHHQGKLQSALASANRQKLVLAIFIGQTLSMYIYVHTIVANKCSQFLLYHTLDMH